MWLANLRPASFLSPRKTFYILRCFSGRAARCTSGVAAVEFALISPLLAFMVIATVDIGMGVYRQMQVENATQAGAQWAIKNGYDSTSISNAVTSATSAPGISVSPAPSQFCGCVNVNNGSSTISTVTCGTICPGGALAGTYTTVSAQMTYNTVLSYGFLPDTYNLSSQATVRLQ